MTTSIGNRVQLPLSELYLSKENSRKSKPSKKADKELKASIKANHIIQNLVVGQKDDQGYPVEAGGRRFKNCMELVKEGHFEADVLIPVLILKPSQSAKNISLIENLIREDTHPVDEYEAFHYMHHQDKMTIGSISSSYGKSKKYIKQRLLLGGVAPKLRELCRSGEFDIEILESFTVNMDNTKQLEAYETISVNNYYDASDIKNFLTDDGLTTDSRYLRFVGLDAYKQAGGKTSDDLFGDVTYINDKKLLMDMANDKMELKRATLLETWSWVDVNCALRSDTLYAFQEISRDFDEVPEKLISLLKDKEKRYEELEDIDWDDKTENDHNEEETLNTEIEELSEQIESCKVFEASEIQFAGAIITLNVEGKEVVYEGLVNKSDAKRLLEFRKSSTSEECESTEDSDDSNEGPIHNQALKQDLSAHCKSIAKVAIANNAKLGSDLALFAICYPVFSDEWITNPLSVRVDGTREESSRNEIAGSKADVELQECFSKLDRSWVCEDNLLSLKAFRALSSKSKNQLAAYAASYSILGFALDSNNSSLSKYIIEESKVEPSQYYRPTADNYFKRVKEPYFGNMGTELLGEQFMTANKSKARSELATHLERAVTGEAPTGAPLSSNELKQWMPMGF